MINSFSFDESIPTLTGIVVVFFCLSCSLGLGVSDLLLFILIAFSTQFKKITVDFFKYTAHHQLMNYVTVIS